MAKVDVECDRCLCRPVCDRYKATGGVKTCEHYHKSGGLFDALESIVWYNGHYEWLKELREVLLELPKGKNYLIPPHIKWHTEEHVIWMLLVGMFGDWGTSVRSGWIQDVQGCIEFIDAICKPSLEAEEMGFRDG